MTQLVKMTRRAQLVKKKCQNRLSEPQLVKKDLILSQLVKKIKSTQLVKKTSTGQTKPKLHAASGSTRGDWCDWWDMARLARLVRHGATGDNGATGATWRDW